MAMYSSNGQEKYAEQMKDQISSWDVMAHQPFSGIKFIPEEGGCRLVQVLLLDPQGWIPDWLIKVGQKRAASNALLLPEYIMNGTVPEPAF